MATVVAATAALALAGAAPALAEHVDFDDPYEFQDNQAGTCAAFGLTPPPADDDWDDTGKVDPPVDIDNDFVEATLSEDGTEVTVVAKSGFVITAVIVKGGTGGGGTAYFHGPFEDLGANVNPQGDPQEISHYVICGEIEEEETTPPPPPPDGNGDDDDDNGDDKETPKPAVPTDVPAGLGDSGGSNAAGMIGLFAVVAGMAAGIAVLVRRRFVEDN
jgi:hypothetical protein